MLSLRPLFQAREARYGDLGVTALCAGIRNRYRVLRVENPAPIEPGEDGLR